MICIFSNINELRKCAKSELFSLYEKNSNYDQRSVTVYHAESTQPEGNQHMYLAYFPTMTKVNAEFDGRSMVELRSKFPKVPPETVKKVWESQQTWGACFDVLNSLVSSQGSLMMEDCGFLLDSISWPSLSGSMTPGSINSGDWAMIDLKFKLEEMEIEASCEEEKEVEVGDWVVLEKEDKVETENLSNSKIQISTGVKGKWGTAGTSFKDVLLNDHSIGEEGTNVRKMSSGDYVWKLSDNDLARRQEKRKTRSPTNSEDSIDVEDHFNDFCQSNEFLKGQVDVTRVKKNVRLRPKAQEKKEKRIAAKAGVSK